MQILQEVYPKRRQPYSLALPAGYGHTPPVPLVIGLHYGWPGRLPPAYFSRGYLEVLAVPALQELGAVIAAPDCMQEEWSCPESEQDVLALVDYLLSIHNLDPHKIVLTGYSQGGRGVWYLAHRSYSRFCAAIPISAPPPPGPAQDCKVPLYVIHSREDELFPYQEVEDYVDNLRESGGQVQFKSLEGLSHFETVGFIEALRTAIAWLRSFW
jgi:dienelactone hydrolase